MVASGRAQDHNRQRRRSFSSTDIPATAIQEQLQKMLASEEFAHAESLSRFLRFVVERTLQGEGYQLKEYRLGVEVFGRGEAFDPKMDTIVRVQARNLRARLQAYYASATAEDAIVIELPKGNYAPVFRLREPVETTTAGRRSWKLTALLAGALLVASAAAYWMFRVRNQPSPVGERASIIVLPFADQSPNQDQAYFSDGFGTELSIALSQVPQLRVVSDYRNRVSENTADLSKTAELLRVKAVLKGNVARAGDLRIRAQLLQVPEGSELWSETYQGPAGKVFAFQEQIARAVLKKLGISWPDREPLFRNRTDKLEAYTLYLRGRYEKRKADAIPLLEQATAEDPNYAPAYAQLASARFVLRSPAVLKAREAAAKSLKIDDKLAVAHLTLARILAERELDWAGAEREFRRCLELSPSSIPARYFYAVLLTRVGRLDEALEQAKSGQKLSPLDPEMYAIEGFILSKKRQHNQAIALLRKAVYLDPAQPYTHAYLAGAYLQKGEFAQALRTLDAAPAIRNRPSVLLGYKGYAHAVSGNKTEARRILRQMQALPPERLETTCVAWIYIGLGERDAAFDSLERALTDDRFMVSGLKIDPIYDSLHSDPRYFALLKQLGLD